MIKQRPYDVKLHAYPDADETITIRIDDARDSDDATAKAIALYPEADALWAVTAPDAWYCVSVYHIDLAYGGPEEGGWHYTTGTPVLWAAPLQRTFRDRNKAIAYMNRLQRIIDALWNKHRRPISSVLSDGVYDVRLDEGHYPASFPSRRPHYE